MAATLGADCAFFVYNRPMMATGIGDVLSAIDVDLKGKTLLLVKPPVGVDTRTAYSRVTPAAPAMNLAKISSPALSRRGTACWSTILRPACLPPCPSCGSSRHDCSMPGHSMPPCRARAPRCLASLIMTNWQKRLLTLLPIAPRLSCNSSCDNLPDFRAVGVGLVFA